MQYSTLCRPAALGLSVLFLPDIGHAQTPYTFTSLDIDKGSQTLVPGDTVHVSWALSSSPGYDSCYVAIRSATSPDIIAAEINPHPQCGASSANLVIPQQAINSSALYNGSPYVLRINTPDGTYSDSAIFQIAEHYSPPWSRTDIIAVVAVVIAVLSAVATIAQCFFCLCAKPKA